jgi:hypothetical protein
VLYDRSLFADASPLKILNSFDRPAPIFNDAALPLMRLIVFLTIIFFLS